MTAEELGIDWGSVPAWVGSVLTGLALLIGAFTYRKSVRDKEREQAINVTLWVEAVDNDEDAFVLHVKNNSKASIYSVTGYYQRQKGQFLPFLSPYYRAQEIRLKSGRRIIEPDLVRLGRWPSIGPESEQSATFKRTADDPQIPWLYFRDSNGVDWIRDYRARLTRHNYALMQYMSETTYLGDTSIWVKIRLAFQFRSYLVAGIWDSVKRLPYSIRSIFDSVAKMIRRLVHKNR